MVICPYCGMNAELVDSSEVYTRSYGLIWLCRPCDAYVGTHRNSTDHVPLGRLANAELRRWRVNAHSAFDPLWLAKMRRDGCSKGQARKAGYQWLAEQLGVPMSECHIGMFDVDMCKRVVQICSDLQQIQKGG